MTTETWQKFESAMERLGVTGQVAVGVSGGADSMALLHLLCAWNKSAGSPLNLTALTVDHGLRTESAREAAAVNAWAKDLGIAHHTLTWHGSKPSSNVEATAREARYRLIGEWCLENDVKNFMTAHHFDDQAETFLMRLARGSGVAGLSAMREERSLGGSFKSVRLMRPLLQIIKADLVALLEEVQQPWLEDPSNEDGDFTRSRIRGLRDTFEGLGLTPDRIVATAARMSEANIVLERAVDEFWQRAVSVSIFGEVTLVRDALLEIEGDTRRRVLARALKLVSGANFGPRYERLLRLERSVQSGQTGAGNTLHGCKICDQGEKLSIIREVSRIDATPMPYGATELWDGRFSIKWADHTGSAAGAGSDISIDIRAIGDAGLMFMRDQDWVSPPGAPRRDLLVTLPAAWKGDQLVFAPFLRFGPDLFKAHFMINA